MLPLVISCGRKEQQQGQCRAWCEYNVPLGGESGDLCADVAETVAGCMVCLDLWGELAVTEAHVSSACACVAGVGSLEPYQACQTDEETWEAELAQYEEECEAEAADYGFTACVE